MTCGEESAFRVSIGLRRNWGLSSLVSGLWALGPTLWEHAHILQMISYLSNDNDKSVYRNTPDACSHLTRHVTHNSHLTHQHLSRQCQG